MARGESKESILNHIKENPGTDFPITEEEYIGKVAYVIPQVGYVTQLLKPPINYVIIVIVIGIMVVKQMTKKKNEKEVSLQESLKKSDTNTESTVDIPKLESHSTNDSTNDSVTSK